MVGWFITFDTPGGMGDIAALDDTRALSSSHGTAHLMTAKDMAVLDSIEMTYTRQTVNVRLYGDLGYLTASAYKMDPKKRISSFKKMDPSERYILCNGF